jgi:histidinol-phosphate aminotransferase
VGPDGIVLGNGSTEMIQVAIQSLAEPGYAVVSAVPTFDDVARYAAPSRVEVVTTPLTADFQHDLTAMEEAARRVRGTALVYVCNPNNPTGTLTSCPDVAAFIERAPDHVHFLVDEAYFEYVDDPTYRSFEKDAFENPNVVVLRTFSKVHGMAGMRLGYAIAHPRTAQRLRGFTADVNADQLVVAAALASLETDDHVRRSVETTRAARDVVYGYFDRLGIDYLPTQASFVMHRVRGELQAYIGRMREAGLLVGRPFPPLLGHNRLSLATPEDMERFGETLTDFHGKGWV